MKKIIISLVVILAATTSYGGGLFRSSRCNNSCNIAVSTPLVTAVQQPVIVSSAVSDYATFVAVQSGDAYGALTYHGVPAVGSASDVKSLNNRVAELTEEVKKLQEATKHGVLTSEAFEAFGNNKSAPAEAEIKGNNLDAAVHSIFMQKCAACHTGEASRGGIKLIEEDGSLSKLHPKVKVLVDYAVYSGRMPKGQPLNDADYNIIRGWTASATQEIISDLLKE